jgi:hypothetical protein
MQLAGRGKKKEVKAPPTLKSGKLTKRAQKDHDKKAEARVKVEKEKKEEATRRDWREKKELGEKKAMTQEWEENPRFFDQYAKGASANPRRTDAPLKAIPMVDLADIEAHNPYLATLISAAIDKIAVRPQTPEHSNRERKLPIYPAGTMAPYWEYSFLGGGGRIVVDAPGRIVYISMHYTYYYKLVNKGATPTGPVTAARSQRSDLFKLEALAARAGAAAGGGGVGAAAAAVADPA